MVAVSRSTKSPWKRLQGSITALNSVDIDVEPNTTKSFSFIIAAEGSGKVKQLHYNLVKDGTLKSNVSAKLGTLKFSISELEVGGNIKVTITNDEVFDIDYEIVVLKLLR